MPPWDRYAPQPTADDAAPAPAGPWAKYAAPVAEDKPQPDTMSDVARSGALGVVEGTGALAGTIPDVKHYQDLGLQWALSKGAEKLGIISPEYGAHLRENMQLGPYRDRSQPDPTDEQINPLGSSSINHHVMQALAKIGVNTDAPQTTAGEYARTIGSFLPSLAAAPENVGVKAALKYAALPGATSETAGQLTKGTDAEPYARLAGAIAPGGVDAAMGTLSRIANPTTRMMGKAVAGTTPQEFDAAQNILNESRAANAPVTVPEALSKATNGGTRLPEIQRVIEGSPEGGPIMKQFYADRPAQVDALGQRTFDQIANAPADPYAVAPRVQGAAQGQLQASPEGANLRNSISKLGAPTSAEEAGNIIRPELQGIYDKREGMRAALADQDYGAARAADYGANGAAANPVQVNAVVAHIDDLLTTAKGPQAAALRDARSYLFRPDGTPDMSVAGLDQARGVISDQISKAVRAGENNGARLLENVQGQLDYALESVPEYGQARRNFAAGSVPLEPFRDDSIAGKIIDKDQFGKNYTMPDERIAPAIQKGGPSSVDQFLEAADNSPDAKRAFARYYAQQLLDNAKDASGGINTDRLATTLQKNQDVLQRFPEIRQQLEKVGDAKTAFSKLEQAPLGQLADTNDFTKQSNILFNSKPIPGSHVAVSDAVKQIAAKDPEAAGQAVRMYLEQTLNKATKGDNQFGAANFVKAIQDPQQMRNIQAALRALPVGQLRADAFQKAVDIFSTMKERLPFNSPTSMNQEIQKGLKAGTIPGELAATILSPGKYPKIAADTYEKIASGKNAKKLAQIFTTGDVSDLRALAGAGAKSIRGRLLLMGVLAKESQAGPQP